MLIINIDDTKSGGFFLFFRPVSAALATKKNRAG